MYVNKMITLLVRVNRRTSHCSMNSWRQALESEQWLKNFLLLFDKENMLERFYAALVLHLFCVRTEIAISVANTRLRSWWVSHRSKISKVEKWNTCASGGLFVMSWTIAKVMWIERESGRKKCMWTAPSRAICRHEGLYRCLPSDLNTAFCCLSLLHIRVSMGSTSLDLNVYRSWLYVHILFVSLRWASPWKSWFFKICTNHSHPNM